MLRNSRLRRPSRAEVPEGSDDAYLKQIEGELAFQWPASAEKTREECKISFIFCLFFENF